MEDRNRLTRWRRAVYAPRDGMTNGCRVLLLRLADGMDGKGVVSIPRSTLAAELGVAPARISENVKLARQLGFLDIVKRARPGVTAVYQATLPNRPKGTPQRTPARGTENSTSLGTPGRTPKRGLEVRPDPHPSSNGNRKRSDSPPAEAETMDGQSKSNPIHSPRPPQPDDGLGNDEQTIKELMRRLNVTQADAYRLAREIRTRRHPRNLDAYIGAMTNDDLQKVADDVVIAPPRGGWWNN